MRLVFIYRAFYCIVTLSLLLFKSSIFSSPIDKLFVVIYISLVLLHYYMDTKASYLSELAAVITKIRDKKVAVDFLRNILTPQELEEIALRLQIFKQLRKGLPQREIAASLGVSVATVSRGSRELKYGPPGFHKVL